MYCIPPVLGSGLPAHLPAKHVSYSKGPAVVAPEAVPGPQPQIQWGPPPCRDSLMCALRCVLQHAPKHGIGSCALARYNQIGAKVYTKHVCLYWGVQAKLSICARAAVRHACTCVRCVLHRAPKHGDGTLAVGRPAGAHQVCMLACLVEIVVCFRVLGCLLACLLVS